MSYLKFVLLILICGLAVLFVIGRIGMSNRESLARAVMPLDENSRFVETRSGRVHVLEMGEGPVIILFHGTGRSTADWKEGLIQRLSLTHRVIAFDDYGVGLSDRDHGLRYGLNLWAQQGIDLMDALGIDRATVVGHSAGGAVISLLAAGHPDRVDKVVILGTGVAIDPMQVLPLIPGVGEFIMGRSEMFTDTFSTQHAGAMKAAYKIKGTRAALLTFIRRQYTIDGISLLRHGFKHIKAPILHLHGEFDASIPLDAGRKLSLDTGAQFVVVPGASHDVHVDAPDFVSQQILQFLSRGTSDIRH